jgi:hypothetical protein
VIRSQLGPVKQNICCVDGLFVAPAVIRSQLGPVKRHSKLKAFMRKNLSHKNNVYTCMTSSSYKRQIFGHVLFAVHKLRKFSWIIRRMVEVNDRYMVTFVTSKKEAVILYNFFQHVRR